MNIEVTNSTFYKIINSSDFMSTDKKEGTHSHYYYNSENDQRGIIVNNFASGKNIVQYYLTDINA